MSQTQTESKPPAVEPQPPVFVRMCASRRSCPHTGDTPGASRDRHESKHPQRHESTERRRRRTLTAICPNRHNVLDV